LSATGVAVAREYYLMPTVDAARWFLGKLLVRELVSGTIVETEAYTQDDPACHAYRSRTERNAAMFGPPGHAYVYFSYGCHFMLNLVTSPEGVGEAILVRALDPVDGVEIMRLNREAPDSVPDCKLCAGPGRLAKALAITRPHHNGIDLTHKAGSLYVLDAPAVLERDVVTSPRVGISRGVDFPWRFSLRGNPAVSRR
jgi:DNA-3-methyladenine glycosylase